jgi:hypothetical protein
MLLLLADYLALDPHPQAGGGAGGGHAGADPESDLTDAQAERMTREIREAIDAGGLTVEPLIATLPDPIESHARWMFDRYLDGLSRGITASGYVMDRFGPESWWTTGNPHGAGGAGGGAAGGAGAEGASADGADAGGGEATHSLHHHEAEPGVVLFRTTDGKRLLVLLIVTETATAGVHAHAMLTALDSAANVLALQYPRLGAGGLQNAAASVANAVGAAGGGAGARAGAIETAAAGADTGDSASARAGVDACCSPSADRTLKVIAPTFSGSAVSLRTTVDRWLSLRTDGCWGLRIVSGSISSVVSRNTLVWDKRVTFQATVPADDALQDALFTYLKSVNGGRGERVAWLVEDNTTFGAAWNPAAAYAAKSAQEAKPRSRKGAASASASASAPASAPASAIAPSAAATSAAPGSSSLADACEVPPPPAPSPRVTPGDDFERIVIPFPMHLSRLHGAAEAERAQAQARSRSFGPQMLLPLRLSDSGSPRDAFPAMTPELTFASVEIALASLLDTIHSEHIRIVAIMATDTRDKLFLADQLARRVPDALLCTLTSDVLYLHPDVNDNVRGMLIASAYPLNPVTQPWTPHDANRVLQIQHNSAQGIYNATVAVLGSLGVSASGGPIAGPIADLARGSNGAVPSNAPAPVSNSALVSNNVAPLLDYGAPGPIRTFAEEVTGPAIWISSVGRDTFWPVQVFDTRAAEPPLESFADAHVIKVRTSRVPRYPVPHLSLSPWACTFFVSMSALALLHVGIYGLDWRRQRRLARDPLHPRAPARLALNWLARSFRPAPDAVGDSPTSASAATTATATPAAATMAAPVEPRTPIVWNDCNASTRRAPVAVYQLVCVVALWTFFTIPVTLSVIWLKAAIEAESPRSAIIVDFLAAALALIAWLGLTALALVLAWRIFSRSSPRWWALWREARGWPTTVRLLLWAIGIIAIAQVSIDVLGHWPSTQMKLWAELPFFMRVTTLGNGVSPAVTYFLLTAAFYAWGLMNLRRLATPTPMLCITLPDSAKPRDWRIALLRGIGFPDPEGVIRQFQCRSTDVFLAVPSTGPLIALISAIVIYVLVLGPTPLTIEGQTFGNAVILSLIVLHVVTGLAVFQFYLLWRTLHAFLEQLSHDGLLDAFKALGERHVRVISAGISLRGPRDIDLYLAEHSPALMQAMTPETERALPAAATTSPGASANPGANANANATASASASPSASPDASIPPVVLEFLTERAARPTAQDDDLTVATLLAYAIQQILTRLGELLAFATVTTLLVITSFATFPFGRGAVLDGFGWLYVFILVTAALVVFIQVARDPILGRLKGYERPGAFNWDRDIVTKLALYAGVPLLGFVTSQFPWLGHVLGEWLQPVQQALPWQ